MDTTSFVNDLRAAGFTLEAAGGKLRIHPASQLNEIQKDFIRQNRAGILKLLAEKPVTGGEPPGCQLEARIERAAIQEFDGGLSRTESDRASGLVEYQHCAHAVATSHPALIDCREETPAPGNAGPHRWWSLDRHSCQRFERKGAEND